MTETPRVYIVTALGEGYGSGHYARMTTLARRLIEEGYETIFVAQSVSAPLYRALEEDAFAVYSERIIQNTRARAIIVDKRETPLSAIRRYRAIGPVIVVDSNGRETKEADIVIEALPSLARPDAANIRPFSCSLFNTAAKQRKKGTGAVRRVFAYFGDTAACIETFIAVAARSSALSFDLYAPGYTPRRALPSHITLKTERVDFSAVLGAYDMAITYFGLTAFEALLANVPVMLLSPTRYHEALAKKNERFFFSLGYYKNVDPRRAEETLAYFAANRSVRALQRSNAKTIDSKNALSRFVEIINGAKNVYQQPCVVCGTPLTKPVSRRANGNVYRCRSCGALTQAYFLPLTASYSDRYFTTDYKRQYGKTYESDKSALRLLARNRLETIRKLRPQGTLIDLGCALGFFLDEARREGYAVSGIDASAYAVNYAKERLGLAVKKSAIESFRFEKERYDVVTAWYALEHLPNIETLLAAIHGALTPGGIFAFSMPNPKGITARMRAKKYYAAVPNDHRYEFSPKEIDRLLTRAGFKKRAVIATGIHPNRFLEYTGLSFLRNNTSFNARYKTVARKWRLGDTFEGYYEKI